MKKRTFDDVIRYESTFDQGLTRKQVTTRVLEGLDNRVKTDNVTPYLKIIFKDVFTFYNLLLGIIGVLLLIFKEWGNCFFLIIVISNTLVGLFQDIRAKIRLDNLTLINESKVEVIRQGKHRKIRISELVLDDVIVVNAGDQIPCDSVILKGEADVNESILTGESLPVFKAKNDTVLSGSYLTKGNLVLRVNAVGESGYVNKLKEKSRKFKAPKSKMNSQLNALFKAISAIVCALGALTLISKGFVSDAFKSWADFKANFVTVAGSLVAMIPSGMYLLISTTLTVSVISLSNKKVFVNDLYAIETMARVNTICIDKTGTITDGNMSVLDVVLVKNCQFKKDKFDVILSSYLAATKEKNATGVALENCFGTKSVFDSKDIINFDSKNKFGAATLSEIGTICIGAFGFVPLKDNSLIKEEVENYSEKGYRVLVVAHSNSEIKNKECPKDLDPIALILLQDHIRDNIKDILNKFQNSGVEIKVISGDNVLTVAEVSRLVGIIGSDKYISLENLSKEQVAEAALKYTVFGRVSPEQKEIIVRALEQNKRTVAMFGDGVNDILALKKSNVAITVGSATRAAKGVSKIILYDDDFGKIPEVCLYGRRVINNLQRTCILFLSKTVFAMITTIGFLLLTLFGLGITYPLSPKHFYAWEIFSIGLSAFFIALERNDEGLVKGNFLKNVSKDAILNGTVLAFEILALFIVGKVAGIELDRLVNVSVYVLAAASILFLIEISAPFNTYRRFVLYGDILAILLLFIISLCSGFNVIGLSKNGTIKEVILSVCFAILIIILALLIRDLIIHKKRKGEKNG